MYAQMYIVVHSCEFNRKLISVAYLVVLIETRYQVNHSCEFNIKLITGQQNIIMKTIVQKNKKFLAKFSQAHYFAGIRGKSKFKLAVSLLNLIKL